MEHICRILGFVSRKLTWQKSKNKYSRNKQHCPLTHRVGWKDKKSYSSFEAENHPKHENQAANTIGKSEGITKSIGIFIDKDFRPQSKSTLEHAWSCLPTWDTFRDNLIPHFTPRRRLQFWSHWKKAGRVAVTCDEWTSSSTNYYVTVSAHFNSECQLMFYSRLEMKYQLPLIAEVCCHGDHFSCALKINKSNDWATQIRNISELSLAVIIAREVLSVKEERSLIFFAIVVDV